MAVFGFFFGSQGLLWGMGFASLPLIIHLLNRRRYRIVDWAAMQWLLEAIRKNRRRIQLEQWLLLALRTLLIVLVVAAMAKPTLQTASLLALAPTTSATHHILVFDNTLSMQYAAANQSRWEKAKGVAHAILDDARKGDLASLVILGTPSIAVVGDASPDLAAVGREIDALKPQHAAGRLDDAMAHVERIVKQSRAASKQIYVLSDLQKSTWLPRSGSESGDQALATAAARLKSLSESAAFTLFDLAESDSNNAAIASIDGSDALVVRNRPTAIRTRIVNHSAHPRDRLRVELAVDGQIEKTETVDLAAGAETTVQFGHRFAEGGEKVVEARIAHDGLKPDDVRRMAINVRDSLRTLLIDGQPSGEPFASETDYLQIALNPRTDDPNASLIRAETKLESDLLDTKLDDYDVVFICNVAQLSSSEIAVLERFLERGGAVAFFLGSQTNAEAFNRLLFAEGAGIFPVRLLDAIGDATKRDRPFAFDPLGYRHPVVQPFRGSEQAGLITARIYRYWKMELPNETKAETVLAVNGKDPAVVVSPMRRGKVAVIATSCDLDWNLWPTSPSFVPVVQELVQYLSENKGQHGVATAGEPIVVPVADKATEVAAIVYAPDESLGAQQLTQEKGAAGLVYPRTDLTGVYRVEITAPVSEEWRFCVNSPIEESDMTHVTAGDLKTSFPGYSFRLLDQWQGRTAGPAAEELGKGEFHRPFLYLALAVALMETLLAWRFGHHR